MTQNSITSPFRRHVDSPGGVQKKSLRAVIKAWLVSKLSQELEIDPDEIDVQESLASYGLSSVQAVSLSGDLEDWLERKLSPTLVYDYPTIESLARYLASEASESDVNLKAKDLGQKAEMEPIAIIGMGCRFPGANNPQAFWELLRNGVDAISEVPKERWDVDRFYDPRPMTPDRAKLNDDHGGKMNTRWGGFLSKVDQFDARFFAISSREAQSMDPQQRLLLEVAWETLEDAGVVPKRLAGTQTGVFIGITSSEYGWLQLGDPKQINPYWSTGNALSIAANRLSYFFDFQGPSMAIDTACSSSLVAIHLACRSLWVGESTLALAGGANLILTPTITINFSQAGGTSPDGRCKAFDADANGMVRSEGVGLVLLKPLSDAQADGDPIYAVIRGSAVNQDGSTNGIAAPNQWSQEAVLREAYRVANVSPGEVQYIEAHGTGTLLGDPIEAKALGSVLNNEPRTTACVIGSVKSNIGHTEAAAGVAGLIKVALSLKQQQIPPSLHFKQPNPYIPFDELALRVPQTLEAWPKPTGALAGVSAFGFGGTNAHVVLQEAPPNRDGGSCSVEGENGAQNQRDATVALTKRPHALAQLLPLSAHTPEALRALVEAYKEYLDGGTADDSIPSLSGVCYMASVRRTHHNHRLAIVFRSHKELSDRLEAFLQDEARAGMSSGQLIPSNRPKVVFVFSGNRPKLWAVGRELEQEPVFRATLEQCEKLFEQYVNWSLQEELTAAARLNSSEIEISQCAMFAIQVALAALWRSWGIEPDAVVGHSFGEVAAAHVAGALSLSDAIRVIFHRSHLLQQEAQQAVGKGAMASVEMPLEEAKQALVGYEDRLSIAVNNSPTSVVLSGDAEALANVVESLRQREIFCRVFDTLGAGHSPQVTPLQSKLVQALKGIQPQAASIPIFSTVTGLALHGREFDAAYWGRNIRESVLFADALNQLAADGYNTFLELSPYPPILSPAISQCLRYRGQKGLVLPTLRRKADDYTHNMGSLGALYTAGYPVEWRKLYPNGGRIVKLPAYPWQRERFWIEGINSKIQKSLRHASVARHRTREISKQRLLGQQLNLAVHSGTHFWEMEISTELFPYLDDHRVQGTILLPTTAYLEMALAAAEEVFGAGHHLLEEVTIDKGLFLPEGSTQTVQLVISDKTTSGASFRFFSRPASETPQEPPLRQRSEQAWTLHAMGMIRTNQTELAAKDHPTPEIIRARCPEIISGAEHYQLAEQQSVQYGPTFQGVEQIWRHAERGEAIGQLRLTESVAQLAYQIHPALLDACLQVLAGTLHGQDRERAEGDLYLPVSVGSIALYNRPHPKSELWGHALRRSSIKTDPNMIAGDVFLLDENGQVIVEVRGFCLQRVGFRPPNLSNWLYEIQWKPKALSQQSIAEPEGNLKKSWVIFTDSRGVGQTVAEQLQARGEICWLISPGENYQPLQAGHYQLNPKRPEDFRQLFQEISRPHQPLCRGVVHLWSLDVVPPEEATLPSLETAQVLGCGSTLYLTQALTSMSDPPRLWLVTTAAQAVGAEQNFVSIAQSPLWGLGKVISFEHPELRCKMVDLSSSLKETHSLFQEFWSDNRENQIALRGDTRYVARLVRSTAATAAAKSSTLNGKQTKSLNYKSSLLKSYTGARFRPDGTYLITGGLGGLGLTVAKWMVQQGVRHLVLMGRSEPSAAAQEALRVMEKAGAKVLVAKADVTIEEQVAGVLAETGASMPPLRGIVHAAATVDPGLLQQLDQERFQSVMAPKMNGAWNLHTQSLNASLDFFVLFSSVASLLGTPGQGNYVVANTFLDALAHHRRIQGLPALSINWGGWSQVGLVARAAAGEFFALRGFENMTPSQGLEVLDRLLQHSIIEGEKPAQVGVMPVKWSRVRQIYPIVQKSPFFSHLTHEEMDAQQKASTEKGDLTPNILLALEPKERQQALHSYLCTQVARTVGISPSKLDIHQPLNTMGIDSLMALEMKNRLESELGVAVPVVRFLEGINVAELTTLLLDQLTKNVPVTTNVNTLSTNNHQDDPSQMLNGQSAVELLAKLDTLPEDEIDALLLMLPE